MEPWDGPRQIHASSKYQIIQSSLGLCYGFPSHPVSHAEGSSILATVTHSSAVWSMVLRADLVHCLEAQVTFIIVTTTYLKEGIMYFVHTFKWFSLSFLDPYSCLEHHDARRLCLSFNHDRQEAQRRRNRKCKEQSWRPLSWGHSSSR